MINSGDIFSDRYTVIAKAGSGGMQDVFQANDKMTEQVVALKTPQAGQTGKHFKQSALIAARINHHNIAKTLDYFEHGGQQYLVEEFVSGGTLEDVTLNRMEFIDPHMAAHLILQLAKGIAASHKAGVIHRDLKPSNILVSQQAGLMTVKITDFGIATLAEHVFEEAVKTGDITRSASGTVRGALPYMSPEMMFRKKGEHPSEPADIWSLGAMLFRLLTGKYPFGEGFQVPVNISAKTREPWPTFMWKNSQFSPLAKSVSELVEKMLQYDQKARPSALEIIKIAEDLSFYIDKRFSGVVDETNFNGAHGKITSSTGSRVFYHSNSVYGRLRPKQGNRVEYCVQPGNPYPRAHPVVVLK